MECECGSCLPARWGHDTERALGNWLRPERECVQVTFPSDSKFVFCVTSGYIFNLKAMRENVFRSSSEQVLFYLLQLIKPAWIIIVLVSCHWKDNLCQRFAVSNKIHRQLDHKLLYIITIYNYLNGSIGNSSFVLVLVFFPQGFCFVLKISVIKRWGSKWTASFLKAEIFLSHCISDLACMNIAEMTGKYSLERKDRKSYTNFASGENILPYSTFKDTHCFIWNGE